MLGSFCQLGIEVWLYTLPKPGRPSSCWHFYIQWQELRLDICPYPKTIWQAWVYLIQSCAMLRPQTVRTRPLPAANWSSKSHKMLRLWSAFQQWLLSNLGRVALANIWVGVMRMYASPRVDSGRAGRLEAPCPHGYCNHGMPWTYSKQIETMYEISVWTDSATFAGQRLCIIAL